MLEKKIRIEKKLATSQIAAFLRLLADELEGKGPAVPNEFGWQLHDFNKLKIKLIRQEGGQLALSLKVKGGESAAAAMVGAEDFTDISEAEYRPLKRQMKQVFGEITACLGRNERPAPEQVERFLDQSRRMIGFAGFGDPFYSQYWRACEEFAAAADRGDLAGMQGDWAAIAECKRACHARFK